MPNIFERIGAAFNALIGRTPEPAAPAAPAPDPGLPDLNLPHTTGFSGGRIISTASPQEVMRAIDEAASEGRRASLNVHDKNGWHQYYRNPASPGRHVPDPGMTASVLHDRLARDGVPGARELEERQQPQPAQPPTPAPVEPAAPDISQVPTQPLPGERPGLGERIRGFFGGIVDRLLGREPEPTPAPVEPGPEPSAPEPDAPDEFPDDFPDDWDGDTGESEGGDDADTEGYDSGSVSGYQVVIYY